MGNGEWGMGNGEWGMGNGEWGIGYSFFSLISLCSPIRYSPPLINKTDTSKEISNCGVGKIARLKQNKIRNLTSSVNRGTTIKTDKCFMLQSREDYKAMSDLNRGIMKFEGADSPKVVTISTVLLLGLIAALIIWALQAAYALN